MTTTKTKGRILTPREFCGDCNGDYGYEINGVKSTKSYISRKGAENAMNRFLFKKYN